MHRSSFFLVVLFNKDATSTTAIFFVHHFILTNFWDKSCIHEGTSEVCCSQFSPPITQFHPIESSDLYSAAEHRCSISDNVVNAMDVYSRPIEFDTAVSDQDITSLLPFTIFIHPKCTSLDTFAYPLVHDAAKCHRLKSGEIRFRVLAVAIFQVTKHKSDSR